MVEESLPAEILSKATRRGDEFAWTLHDVPEVIAAAKALGLAALGGQVQFRTPVGICELYWLDVDSEGRRPGEPWPDYVARSCDEVEQRVRALVTGTDFVGEGLNFPHLARMHADGEELEQYLCFVLYFERKTA